MTLPLTKPDGYTLNPDLVRAWNEAGEGADCPRCGTRIIIARGVPECPACAHERLVALGMARESA